jgi:hypothetical protein
MQGTPSSLPSLVDSKPFRPSPRRPMRRDARAPAHHLVPYRDRNHDLALDAGPAPEKKTVSMIVEKHAAEVFFLFVLAALVVIIVLVVRRMENRRKATVGPDGNPLPETPKTDTSGKKDGGIITTINHYIEGNFSEIEYTHLLGIVMVFVIPLVVIIMMIIIRQIFSASIELLKGVFWIFLFSGIVGALCLYGIYPNQSFAQISKTAQWKHRSAQ